MEVTKDLKIILDEIFGFIGIKPKINIEIIENNVVEVTIIGNDLNFLIGFRGQSLEALQTLLGLILFKKTNEWTTVVVDINDYRSKKIERLHEITKKHIDKVRFFRQETELPPMNPWERRHVHTLVGEYDDVISESTGEGSDRRVVLKPKVK